MRRVGLSRQGANKSWPSSRVRAQIVTKWESVPETRILLSLLKLLVTKEQNRVRGMIKLSSMMTWFRIAAMATLAISAGTASAECKFKDFHEKTWHISSKSFSKTQIVLTEMTYLFSYTDRVRGPRQYTSNDPLTPSGVRIRYNDRFSHDGGFGLPRKWT